MDEYHVLGSLSNQIMDNIDKKMKKYVDEHNVNYCLLYPLAAIELGALQGPPENIDNLFRRCVAGYIYSKAMEFGKDMYIIKFNMPGFKKFLKLYEQELIPLYQNFRFAREINDINPLTKPQLQEIAEHKYKLTTSLVTDQYREENFYFYGEDDLKASEREKQQTAELHEKFFEKIFLEKQGVKELISSTDSELYILCVAIVEKDINKWESNVKSAIFTKPKQLASVIGYFYYHAMIKSICSNIDRQYTNDINEIGTDVFLKLDKVKAVHDIVSLSEFQEKQVVKIVDYLINEGNTNLLEFPLFEIENVLISVPSLILVNDWQFTIVNGHYSKNIIISNREKTISTVTEGRIENILKNISNIAVAKTKPYSFLDDDNAVQDSDIDYAIYDMINNMILVIEAKWIDNHYMDEIDKRYGKILQTINKIYSKQIHKHMKFLNKVENIDFLFNEDMRYERNEVIPKIVYLAVDKRNQIHIYDKHMISEYMLVYFLKKNITNNVLNLSSLWSEIEKLQTKVEYISCSDEYNEFFIDDDTVLVEKDDIHWK